MIKYLSLLLFILVTSCNNKGTKTKTEKSHENSIIAERIDGPANIREKPNGKILFQLNDNVLVDVSELKNDWYEILIRADIDYDEFDMDSISKNRLIRIDNDTIGQVINTHTVSTGRGKDFAYAILYGYTHKNNIKPETKIEDVFQKKLSSNNRNLSEWKNFINSFDLKKNAFDHKNFKTFYNYESTVNDPSPGFRIVLLFEEKKLIGFFHSREFKTSNTETYKLISNHFMTFFKDFNTQKKADFIKYVNEWLQGVD